MGVGRAPGATASVGRGEGRVGGGHVRAGRASWSVLGAGGLTRARAEVPDRDVQALAAGDGPQLALITVGDSVRPTHLGTGQGCRGCPPRPTPPPSAHPLPHLGSIGLRTGGCWAHTMGGASLLHAGGPKLTVHFSTGPGHRGVWHRHRRPTGSGAASVMATPPAQVTTRPPPAPAPPRPPAGPHRFHSQQGPGHGRRDTAHTWVRPPQACRSTAQSSAHSRPARHPGGHSYRLRGRGGA